MNKLSYLQDAGEFFISMREKVANTPMLRGPRPPAALTAPKPTGPGAAPTVSPALAANTGVSLNKTAEVEPLSGGEARGISSTHYSQSPRGRMAAGGMAAGGLLTALNPIGMGLGYGIGHLAGAGLGDGSTLANKDIETIRSGQGTVDPRSLEAIRDHHTGVGAGVGTLAGGALGGVAAGRMVRNSPRRSAPIVAGTLGMLGGGALGGVAGGLIRRPHGVARMKEMTPAAPQEKVAWDASPSVVDTVEAHPYATGVAADVASGLVPLPGAGFVGGPLLAGAVAPKGKGLEAGLRGLGYRLGGSMAGAVPGALLGGALGHATGKDLGGYYGSVAGGLGGSMAGMIYGGGKANIRAVQDRRAAEAAAGRPKTAAMDPATLKALIIGGVVGGGLGAGAQALSSVRGKAPESASEMATRHALESHERGGAPTSYLGKVRGAMLRSMNDVSRASAEHPLAATMTAAVPSAVGGAMLGKNYLAEALR